MNKVLVMLVAAFLATGCVNVGSLPTATPSDTASSSKQYVIGAGDQLEVFVWRNTDLSKTVTVRPDGRITTPLVEDLPAEGKTTTELARDLEKSLEKYIRNPVVTVLVKRFVGPYSEQIRIVGEAARPQSLSYRKNMTVLDAMIAVGGLTEFADGNGARLIRIENGTQKQFSLRLKDLLKSGDISANVFLKPGDILIVPEALF